MSDALDAVLRSGDLVAVLGREVAVRLVDISASGCLLESDSGFIVGSTGSLRVVHEGTAYMDDVRIIRCRECEGSSTLYRVGAEFLWTQSPRDQSLRRVLSRLHAAEVKAAGLQSECM